MSVDGFERDFGDLHLDDDFIKGASTKELSATDRARRDERRHNEGLERQRQERDARKARRIHRRFFGHLRNRPQLIIAFITAAIVSFVFMHEEQAAKVGLRSGHTASTKSHDSDNFPTPRKIGNPTPLGTPASVPLGAGPYKFLDTQPNSQQPVTYDPCRVIEVVINPRTAPLNGDILVREAFDRVSAISGLQFQIVGETDEKPSKERAAFQPERYGDKWAPVLVAWSDPLEYPDLEGEVAGMGGSSRVRQKTGNSTYVSGEITLDGPDISDLVTDGYIDEARAVIMHEIGHLLGLDHVNDESHVMHERGKIGVSDFASGDKAGLALLGQGACNKEL